MLSDTDKKTIFSGLPKVLVIGSTEYTAHLEYADRGPAVTTLLKDHPLVATLRYYNDIPDIDATPGNGLLGRAVVNGDIQYTRGKIRRITASFNIYAQDTDTLPPAADLIDPYANVVLLWVQNTLPKQMSIAVDPTVSDLNYLEAAGTERRQVEWAIRYELSVTESVKTIDTVDPPIITIS